MGMMIGLTSFLPSVVTQASLGLLMICANAVDQDIEAFVVLVLFAWWIRDIHIICQKILSLFIENLKPSPKPPPWMDPAPYMPGG